MTKNNYIATAIVLSIVLAWLFRYDLTSTGSGAITFRLDRWTGQVHFIRGQAMEAVQLKEPDWWLSDEIVPTPAAEKTSAFDDLIPSQPIKK